MNTLAIVLILSMIVLLIVNITISTIEIMKKSESEPKPYKIGIKIIVENSKIDRFRKAVEFVGELSVDAFYIEQVEYDGLYIAAIAYKED
ncbi:hypothetical protein ACYSNL_04970 [Enterococcus cecorum]